MYGKTLKWTINENIYSTSFNWQINNKLDTWLWGEKCYLFISNITWATHAVNVSMGEVQVRCTYRLYKSGLYKPVYFNQFGGNKPIYSKIYFPCVRDIPFNYIILSVVYNVSTHDGNWSILTREIYWKKHSDMWYFSYFLYKIFLLAWNL